MTTIHSPSSGLPFGLDTPFPLHRSVGNVARSRLLRSQSAPTIPSTILVSKKKPTKLIKKASPTKKKMTQSRHIQPYSKPPLARRQISDELAADAWECAKIVALSPFDINYWNNIDSAASTASTKFNEVQSDIETAWNSLADIVSHVFSSGTSDNIDQCEFPTPSLKDVDDEELFGLQFVEEDINAFDYSFEGLEVDEQLLQEYRADQ